MIARTGLNRRTKYSVAAVMLLVFASMFFVLTSQAGAQLPSACEQYPDRPQCIVDAEDGDIDGDPGSDLGPDAGAGNNGGTGDGGSGGSLPFTGYPLSAIVILMLVLLLTGLASRGYTAARDRTLS